MCANESIDEYHCCEDCRYSFIVPVDVERWQVDCNLNKIELNRSGGLTRCKVWKERI